MKHAKLFLKTGDVEVKQYGQPTPANPLDQKDKDEDDLKIKKPLLPGQPGNPPANAASNGPLVQQTRAALHPKLLNKKARGIVSYEHEHTTVGEMRSFLDNFSDGVRLHIISAASTSPEVVLNIYEMWDAGGTPTISIDTDPFMAHYEKLFPRAPKYGSGKTAGPPKGNFSGEFPYGKNRHKRYTATGEYRPPLKGEYFLSGANITAYRAPNDYGPNMKYWIAVEHTPVPCPTCGHVAAGGQKRGSAKTALTREDYKDNPLLSDEESHLYCPRCKECVTCNLRPCNNGGPHLPGVTLDHKWDEFKQGSTHQDLINEAMAHGEFGRRYPMEPKAEAAARKHANNDLAKLSRKYHSEMPLQEMRDILKKYGFDPRVMDGIYTGDDGKMNEQCGHKTWLAMTWHKLPKTGLWEIVTYLS